MGSPIETHDETNDYESNSNAKKVIIIYMKGSNNGNVEVLITKLMSERKFRKLMIELV